MVVRESDSDHPPSRDHPKTVVSRVQDVLSSGTDEMMRVSDADRQPVIDRLSAAVGEGRLNLNEFTDRVDAAVSATYHRQLKPITGGLPAPADTDLERASARKSAAFADIQRGGTWSIPAHGKWKTLFGNVLLDLREARVSTLVACIEVNTVFGNVEILVPAGVGVTVRSRLMFGDLSQPGGEPAQSQGPRIIVTGTCVFGDLRILPYRRWWGR